MRAIIVDDEPKGITLLTDYLGHFEKIRLVDTFRNGLKALEYIAKNKVDVIFLDINMPHIDGLSLSRMIGPQTKIIFTTAYAEFAVESYEVEAFDYLLKPISLKRFSNTMKRLFTENDRDSETTIHIKSGTTRHFLKPSRVTFLEKDGNYMIYHTEDAKIMARETIREALDKLPETFRQVHRSYIVNMSTLTGMDVDKLMIGKVSIPIGSSFKSDIEDIINR